jgi:translation elongation factor P/translation initiation factor 5A
MTMTDIAIGTTFLSGGKNKKLCTVNDIFKTYNGRGELVKVRYSALHLFMGQTVAEYDIVETTIKRGLVE